MALLAGFGAKLKKPKTVAVKQLKTVAVKQPKTMAVKQPTTVVEKKPSLAVSKMPRAANVKKPKATIVIALTCLLALAACYVTLSPGGDLMVLARTRELPVYSVERDDKVLAISFDAAWGGSHTKALLDILDEYQVKTTFFLVGTWVERYPELVQEIVTRGHEIGNHSTSHPQMSKLSAEKIREELKATSDRIEQLTGVRPTLFRPPFGDYNDQVVKVSRAEGYECVQWNVDSLDWKNRGVEDLIRNATRNNNPGDIVLFHNDSQFILDALPTILKRYQDAGFKVIPVSQILLSGNTTIDHTGRQHPVAQSAEITERTQ